MFGQIKLENHRGHIALFCIALCGTVLFWIILICVAAFILLATAETSVAQSPDLEAADYQDAIGCVALMFGLDDGHARSIDNSRTQV